MDIFARYRLLMTWAARDFANTDLFFQFHLNKVRHFGIGTPIEKSICPEIVASWVSLGLCYEFGEGAYIHYLSALMSYHIASLKTGSSAFEMVLMNNISRSGFLDMNAYLNCSERFFVSAEAKSIANNPVRLGDVDAMFARCLVPLEINLEVVSS